MLISSIELGIKRILGVLSKNKKIRGNLNPDLKMRMNIF